MVIVLGIFIQNQMLVLKSGLLFNITYSPATIKAKPRSLYEEKKGNPYFIRDEPWATYCILEEDDHIV